MFYFLKANLDQLNSSEFVEDYNLIFNKIMETAEELVVLTLPPVPKLGYKNHSLRVWKDINQNIRSLGTREGM